MKRTSMQVDEETRQIFELEAVRQGGVKKKKITMIDVLRDIAAKLNKKYGHIKKGGKK